MTVPSFVGRGSRFTNRSDLSATFQAERRGLDPGVDGFRAAADKILTDMPEHNRVDEHVEVLAKLVEAFTNHR